MARYQVFSSHHCNPCLVEKAARNTSNEDEEDKSPDSGGDDDLTTTQSLRKCSSCKLTVYCSVKHQKSDWNAHKQFCRAISKIMKTCQIEHPFYLNGIPKSRMDIEYAGVKLRALLTSNLGRQIEFSENELSTFPAYCGRCFKFNGPLRVCKRCRAVSYCNETHAREDLGAHRRVCSSLQIYYSHYKLIECPEVDISIKHPIDRFEAVLSLSAAIQMASESRSTANEDPTASCQAFQYFYAVSGFSCIATICYVLEKINFTVGNDEISIHIVGATLEAEFWFKESHTRLIFLQYQNLRNLKLHFIGPEVIIIEDDHKSLELLVNDKSCSVEYNFYEGNYEDFQTDTKTAPDLIIAFNCGFSEPTFVSANEPECFKWRPAIRAFLSQSKVPIAFTSFTKTEAESDYQQLAYVVNQSKDKVSCKQIMGVVSNPFKDPRPYRNWQVSDTDVIFHRNGYIQVIIPR